MRNRILASSLVISLIGAFAGLAVAQSRDMSPGSSDMKSDMKSERSGSSSVGQFVDDATVTTRVKSRFARDDQVSAMNINVETNEGVVQLSGYAGSEAEKTRAAEIASQVPDVKSVQNNIVVRAGQSGSGTGSTGGSGSYGTPSGSGSGTYR